MKRYICSLIALLFIGCLSAQTLNQAKKLFDNGEYEKAKKAFARFIRNAPASAEYNYYFGACCYETGEKEKALPYLEKSARRRYIGAYRYLGMLYADMYRYEEAVENYETHIEWLVEKKRDTSKAEEELSILRHKARMYKSVEKVIVVDSIIINKSQFLDAFILSKSAGIISMNEAKNGTIYENEMGNKRIISEMKDSLMQLYGQEKRLDDWGKKRPIESLNDSCNINYPFVMGDGVTIYYASDNERGMGGYDIYVTRYDSEDNTYLRPSNIGMPYNSPANDYLYVVDEFNHLGWFVTDRNQPADSVCVYIFIPNESKQVYNYEATDPDVIKDVASLHSIQTTWTDEEAVRDARQRLAALKYSGEKEAKVIDFNFIIDDSATYHTLADFRSSEAKDAYRQLIQMEKDLAQLKDSLEKKRQEYESENGLGKKKLEPSILDLEKRIPELMQEVEKLTLEVRRLEVEELRK